jgi:hypothetical protein
VTHDVRDTLFPNADDDALADAYAQTCAYCLLLAQSEGAAALDAASVEATDRCLGWSAVGSPPILAVGVPLADLSVSSVKQRL